MGIKMLRNDYPVCGFTGSYLTSVDMKIVSPVDRDQNSRSGSRFPGLVTQNKKSQLGVTNRADKRNIVPYKV